MGIREELDQLKKRRRSVKPDELNTLLTRAGFTRTYGKGDHWIYRHPDWPFALSIDPRNPLLPAYVSEAIRAIEGVLTDDDD